LADAIFIAADRLTYHWVEIVTGMNPLRNLSLHLRWEDANSDSNIGIFLSNLSPEVDLWPAQGRVAVDSNPGVVFL
jgi:hypothetical protein